MPNPYRHTKVVFTIGPATESEDELDKLIRQGVDVCRLNMAHANHDWTRAVIERIQRVCERTGRQIAIMMDVKGPEIRTGPVEKTFHLEAGELFDLYIKPDELDEADRKGARGVSINYPSFANDVKAGDTVLVDSGLIRMRVEDVEPRRVRCKVIIPGPMGSRRHINLPGVKVNLPALTAKDKADIEVGIEAGVDFFALSFVREPDDLDILRRFISERGSQAKIIAKVEDQTAVTNLEEIILASDGLMVARGDLGIEIPYETLPVVQRRAVKECLRVGKPVIVATHMLESMITQPLPTRAEITDVANAVSEQADCVMLSGETTIGKYPAECVDVLDRIIRATEGQSDRPYNTTVRLRTPKGLLLRSAVILSDELEDAAILAFTKRGYIAQTLSALRPRKSPIFAFTDNRRQFRQMLILWGVEPFLMEFDPDPEKTIGSALDLLKKQGWASEGRRIIVVSNVLASERMIDTIQLRTVE